MSKKILLVEDTPDLLANLKEFLVMEGYSVSGFSSARAALEDLKNSIPDLIITDLSMPDMDGFEFIEQLRQINAFKETPLIIFSARPMQENIQRANSLCVAKYIKKPCSVPDFLICVEQVFKH